MFVTNQNPHHSSKKIIISSFFVSVIGFLHNNSEKRNDMHANSFASFLPCSTFYLVVPCISTEMEAQIIWLKGKPKFGRIEKICPKRHVRQHQWQPEWNKEYESYNAYISDYESIFNYPVDYYLQIYQGDFERWQNLQAAKKQGTDIPVTNLVHLTNEKASKQIVNDNGFRGGQKKINENEKGNDVKASLSWWSPIFTEDEKNNVRVHLGKAIQPFLSEQDNQEIIQNQFAKSNAFHLKPWRNRNCLFQYGLDELCQLYGEQVKDNVQYKVLGTFGYKQEVMHAVLVCSQANGAGRFADYPDVLSPEEDVNNEAVVTRDVSGNWVWKPQATATEIKRLKKIYPMKRKSCSLDPLYRRWEHLAFAFHIPSEWGENGMIKAHRSNQRSDIRGKMKNMKIKEIVNMIKFKLDVISKLRLLLLSVR